MPRVCPKCNAVSDDDLYCPNDGTKLVESFGAPAPPSSTSGVAAPVRDPFIGQLVASRYRVLGQLGEGGMGNVYRAVQESIEKKVALKVLKAEYSSSPDMVVRFQREAVSACRIKHPNVVDVFDLGQLADGRFYIAMDLLEGSDLAQTLVRAGALPPARATHIALQICRALNAAHQSGIVHRDLKPENVFLHRTSDGAEIVKIVDFGIAHLLAHGSEVTSSAAVPGESPEGDHKLTRVGTVFGTPEYMAPEQAAGIAIDHRADIYAAGIILYKMLTGHTPFTGTSFLEIISKHVAEEPPRMTKLKPDLVIPRELEQVVMRALAKKPEDRFENMARFAQAIAYASRDLRRSRPFAFGTWWTMPALVAVAALLGLGAWIFARKGPDRPPAHSADVARVPDRVPTSTNEHQVVPAATGAQALPVPAPAAPSSPAPTVSAAPPVPSAATAASALPPRAAREAKGPSSSSRAPAAEPRLTTTPKAGVAAPESTSLPPLERCFETVEGVRHEVPCH